MDIQRIVLFAGLAIVSYLMVLAWNEDYHQPVDTATVQEQSADNTAVDDELSLPGTDQQVPTTTGDFQAPGDETAASASDLATADRLVTVRTDVLELKIDRVGGNVVEASLLEYDRTLDSEQPLRLLQTTENRTYFLESGLIGRDGFDSRKNGETPVYQVAEPEMMLAEGQNSL